MQATDDFSSHTKENRTHGSLHAVAPNFRNLAFVHHGNILVTAKMVICVSVAKIKLHAAVIKYKIYFLSSRGNHDRDIIIAVIAVSRPCLAITPTSPFMLTLAITPTSPCMLTLAITTSSPFMLTLAITPSSPFMLTLAITPTSLC